jgi:hypothetical protein
VVHAELVEVHQQQPGAGAVVAGPVQRGGQSLVEVGTVGQAGEVVVQRLVPKGLRQARTLGDVLERDADAVVRQRHRSKCVDGAVLAERERGAFERDAQPRDVARRSSIGSLEGSRSARRRSTTSSGGRPTRAADAGLPTTTRSDAGSSASSRRRIARAIGMPSMKST